MPRHLPERGRPASRGPQLVDHESHHRADEEEDRRRHQNADEALAEQDPGQAEQDGDDLLTVPIAVCGRVCSSVMAASAGKPMNTSDVCSRRCTTRDPVGNRDDDQRGHRCADCPARSLLRTIGRRRVVPVRVVGHDTLASSMSWRSGSSFASSSSATIRRRSDRRSGSRASLNATTMRSTAPRPSPPLIIPP